MKKSKTALIISAVYLLLVVLSFFIMLITLKSTPMAGIFLVLLTWPWPTIIDMSGVGQGDAALINGLLMLAGGILNGLLLYFLIYMIGRLTKNSISRR